MIDEDDPTETKITPSSSSSILSSPSSFSQKESSQASKLHFPVVLRLVGVGSTPFFAQHTAPTQPPSTSALSNLVHSVASVGKSVFSFWEESLWHKEKRRKRTEKRKRYRK